MSSPRRSARFWIALSLYTAGTVSLGYLLGSKSSSQPSSSGPVSGAIARAPANPPIKGTGPTRNASDARLTDAENARILQAAKPGVPNQLLLDRLADALFETDDDLRFSRFQSLLALMRPEDAALAEQVFYNADKDGRSYGKEWHAFFAAWGRVDGPAAMQQLQNSNHLVPFSSLAGGAARNWARISPQAALKWLGEQEKTPGLRHARELREGIWEGIMQHDPAGSVDLLVKSFPREEATRRLGTVAGMVVNAGGLDAGQIWLAQQSARTDLDPAFLKEAFGTIAHMTVRAGADRFAQFIASRPDAAELREKVPAIVSGWWPSTNAARLDFMETMPECYDQAAVTRGLSHFQYEPDALGQWLNDHPNTRFYDEATEVYVRSLQNVDPAAALKWASTIKNPARRAKLGDALRSTP